jgi:mono/diheme cytochrome c family protein|tara:strand:+ start:1177 stop:1932 length:756 start_codon:yes stop_codon:yes gene_type:complete
MKVLNHIFFKSFLILVATILIFKFAVVPIIPKSVFTFYVIVIVAGLILFITATTKNQQSAWGTIENLLTNDKQKFLRWFIMLLIPLVVAVYTGISLIPSNQAPIALRVIHPAPPGTIDLKGKSINLREAVNPFRKLEKEDPDAFAEHVETGRRVYYENCHYCHGDFLDGKGPFANALDPKPANFQDIGTIAQLQESYVFWRIAKGGPGLPNESMPWQTAMPAWENFISEDEIWEVTLFLYYATHHPPRTWE